VCFIERYIVRVYDRLTYGTRMSLNQTLGWRRRRPSVNPKTRKSALLSFAQLQPIVELQSLKVAGIECGDVAVTIDHTAGASGVHITVPTERVA
jgi:hypothetical protein